MFLKARTSRSKLINKYYKNRAKPSFFNEKNEVFPFFFQTLVP